jgi:hypothetical protein
VRALLALPFAALAVLAHQRGAPTPLNETTDAAGSAVEWGATDFSWIGTVYPPIPTGIAALLPGGTLPLGLVGALAAGWLIQTLVERMRGRGVPLALRILLLATLVGTPFFGYMSTSGLAEFLGFSLVTIAMAGFLRFAVYGDTDGGFQAGLLLGLAAACDPSTVVFAVTLGLAAPFVARQRFLSSPRIGRASAAVLAFPSLMAAAGWAFLEWRFTGTAFAAVQASVVAADPTLGGLAERTTTLLRVTATLPLVLVSGVLLFLRRRSAIVGYLLPFPALVLSLWLGLRAPSGTTVLLLTALAILAVPSNPTRRLSILLGAAAIAQLVLVWLVVLSFSPDATAWADTLLGR